MKLYISYHTGFTPERLARLERLGFEIVVGDRMRERTQCPPEAKSAEAIICFRLFDVNPIEEFRNLRLIHTTSAGLDHMPLQYIREKGIAIFNGSGVYSAPMAEYALGGVLHFYKHMPQFAENRRSRTWKQDFGLLELGGKHVSIVGAGSIGTQTAKRFAAMGCRVTGFCRHPEKRAYFDEVLPIERLDEMLPQSDILILCLPLTPQTHHLMNEARFSALKGGAVFVNMARGAVTDTDALVRALRSGRLLGAVLDVFEEEPLPGGSPLWTLPNCIVTPHNSFSGDGNNDRLFELVYRNFREYLHAHGITCTDAQKV